MKNFSVLSLLLYFYDKNYDNNKKCKFDLPLIKPDL